MSERRRARPSTPINAPRRQPRRTDPSMLLWLGAAALLLIVAVLVGAGLYAEYYVPPRETVLKVGDRAFTMQYLVERTRYYIAEAALRGGAGDAASALAFTLDEMEREELLRQLGPAEGLAVTEQDVEQTLRTRVAQITGRSLPPPAAASPTAGTESSPAPTATTATIGDDDFKLALRDVKKITGLSEEELREIAHAQALTEKLRQVLTEKLPATAPQVQFLTIFVDTREQADRAKKRLDDGEDFEAVQSEVSPQTMQPPVATPTPTASPEAPTPADSPATVQRESPAWLTAEMIRAPFSEPAFRTPAGQYTNVIASDRGFAILKILGREDARPLEEVQRNFLLERALNDWRSQRLHQVTIKRSLDADKTDWALRRISG